jgi:Domain of unknown function (DUF5658)
MPETEFAVQSPTSLDHSRTALDHSRTALDQDRTSLNQLLWQFSYLQILDFLTTVAFLLHGVREGNPLVRLALSAGANPLVILVVVKLVAIVLGLYCWHQGRRQLLFRINILFALLVAWNLVALIVSSVKQ